MFNCINSHSWRQYFFYCSWVTSWMFCLFYVSLWIRERQTSVHSAVPCHIMYLLLHIPSFDMSVAPSKRSLHRVWTSFFLFQIPVTSLFLLHNPVAVYVFFFVVSFFVSILLSLLQQCVKLQCIVVVDWYFISFE